VCIIRKAAPAAQLRFLGGNSDALPHFLQHLTPMAAVLLHLQHPNRKARSTAPALRAPSIFLTSIRPRGNFLFVPAARIDHNVGSGHIA